MKYPKSKIIMSITSEMVMNELMNEYRKQYYMNHTGWK
jgi:hypothetical protein